MTSLISSLREKLCEKFFFTILPPSVVAQNTIPNNSHKHRKRIRTCAGEHFDAFGKFSDSRAYPSRIRSELKASRRINRKSPLRMAQKQIFFSIFLVICLSTLGDAIKCYQCNDTAEPKCKDGELDLKSLVSIDCVNATKPEVVGHAPINQCSKIIRKVGDKLVTHRGCFFPDPNNSMDKCMKRVYNDTKDYVVCERCETDDCNPSSRVYGSLTVFMFSVMALMVK